MTNLVTHEEFCAEEFCVGLRELAQWYEEHPEVPLPYCASNGMPIFGFSWDEAAATKLAVVARAMGKAEKLYRENSIEISRSFGPIRLYAYCSRDAVCTKVKTGTRTVLRDKMVNVGREEVEEDVFEWECGPILQGEEED